MVVRALSSVVGTGVPSGISWWWNHAAPGASHAMTAGITVDTVHMNVASVKPYLENRALTGFNVQEQQLIDPRKGGEVRDEWHFLTFERVRFHASRESCRR